MTVQQQLDDEREATLARLAALTRDLDALQEATADVPDDEHDPEGSTIGFERAQVISLVAATRRHLRELDAAEARLRSGAYGWCERCEESIGTERLRARPSARSCISCAAAAEH